MKAPDPALWSGACSGGYFAAAAVYLGNIAVLAVQRGSSPAVMLAMGTFPVACAVMGGIVLARKPWAPKWSLVVAAGFAAIHLIGLAYLFFDAQGSVPAPTGVLQWRLGSSFLALWLFVVFAASRLARSAQVPAPGP